MENAPVTANPEVSNMLPIPTTPLGMMQSNMSRQPIMKQVTFLLAIAASLALGGYVLMWSLTPNYQVLFAGMEAKESAEVVALLQQSDVDYKLDAITGAVLVPASKIQGLRLKMAAEGLPHSSSQGMEMLNEEQGFGTSQFIERARYQRAMEEELSRSISAINNVRSARVHIAAPKQSVFIRERKPPSASVILNLYAGRTLQRNQIAAITHMVASSIPNLASSEITIVDQRGNLLTKPERDQNMAMSDSQFEYTQKLEKLYISRIEDILSPIVGSAGVRAQVVAEVDFTVTEQTHERFNPDRSALRSEQSQEDNRVGATGPLGVPGALSNQPPGGGIAPELVEGEEVVIGEDGEPIVASLPGSSSKSSTRNYELDRTISHTRVAPGSVRKLSVAVLIDERREEDGESIPLTEIEMARINALVMDAIGFNKARGDSLNIVNAPFILPPEIEALPEVPLLEQAWIWDVAKQAAGGLFVLFLLFGVIRPTFKDLTKIPVAAADDMTPKQAIDNATSAEEFAKITTGSEDMEGQLNNVRSLVQQDPALVAQVVKNWTASDA